MRVRRKRKHVCPPPDRLARTRACLARPHAESVRDNIPHAAATSVTPFIASARAPTPHATPPAAAQHAQLLPAADAYQRHLLAGHLDAADAHFTQHAAREQPNDSSQLAGVVHAAFQTLAAAIGNDSSVSQPVLDSFRQMHAESLSVLQTQTFGTASSAVQDAPSARLRGPALQPGQADRHDTCRQGVRHIVDQEQFLIGIEASLADALQEPSEARSSQPHGQGRTSKKKRRLLDAIKLRVVSRQLAGLADLQRDVDGFVRSQQDEYARRMEEEFRLEADTLEKFLAGPAHVPHAAERATAALNA